LEFFLANCLLSLQLAELPIISGFYLFEGLFRFFVFNLQDSLLIGEFAYFFGKLGLVLLLQDFEFFFVS
jgi:hypothetical protein